MTPEEFLKTVRGYQDLPDNIKYDLLVLYWISICNNKFFLPKGIQEIAESLRISTFSSFPSYVSRFSKKVNGKQKFIKLVRGYSLDQNYERELNNNYRKRKESINVGIDLRKLQSTISDPQLSEYMQEAIECFENNLLRSSIVMTWCWIYHILGNWIFLNHVASFNAKCSTWKNPISINTIDDFENILEATVIDTCKSIGIISKELFKTLKSQLDLRNSYAHPSNKPSSSSIAEAYIVTAIKEILPKLK